MYTFNLDLSGLGMPRDAFGGVTITNVGSLGLDIAYVPLVPYTGRRQPERRVRRCVGVDPFGG